MIPRSRYARAAACFGVLTTALLLGATAGASLAGKGDFDSRIGVFYDDCLSIGSNALEPGTPVTIIRFNSEDENQVRGDTRDRRIAAKVAGKAKAVGDCPTWIEDRTLREDSAKLSLYTLTPEIPGTLDSVERGIGIVGIPPGDEKPIDIDGNGVVDTFSEFVTFGGLVFEVWEGKMWFGKSIWTGSWHYDHGPDGPDEPEEQGVRTLSAAILLGAAASISKSGGEAG